MRRISLWHTLVTVTLITLIYLVSYHINLTKVPLTSTKTGNNRKRDLSVRYVKLPDRDIHNQFPKYLKQWPKNTKGRKLRPTAPTKYSIEKKIAAQQLKYVGDTSDCIDGRMHKFNLRNEDDQVRQLSWLCVSSQRHARIKFRGIRRVWYLGKRRVRLPIKECGVIPSKRITMHRVKNNSKEFRLHGFWIHPSTKGMPPDFTMSNDTAYFLGKNELPSELENLFHFIKQVFFPLHFMIKSTNRLGQSMNNVVFYNAPLGRCPGKFSRYQMDYVKPFYQMLNINDPYTSAFEDLPQPKKVCYRNAIISKSLHLNQAHEALEFVKKQFEVAYTSCQPKLATFISRKSYRRILNQDALVEVAKTSGYNVAILHLEDLPLKEQAQQIYCSEILVGVTGAGLQWAYFMKNNSGVVEIAWPQFQWPFFFSAALRKGDQSRHSGLNGIRPLRFATVIAEKCHPNPEAINMYHKSIFHVASNFSKEESLQILMDRRNSNFKKDTVISTGKFCDVTVQPQAFKKALERLSDCKKKMS